MVSDIYYHAYYHIYLHGSYSGFLGRGIFPKIHCQVLGVRVGHHNS